MKRRNPSIALDGRTKTGGYIKKSGPFADWIIDNLSQDSKKNTLEKDKNKLLTDIKNIAKEIKEILIKNEIYIKYFSWSGWLIFKLSSRKKWWFYFSRILCSSNESWKPNTTHKNFQWYEWDYTDIETLKEKLKISFDKYWEITWDFIAQRSKFLNILLAEIWTDLISDES